MPDRVPRILLLFQLDTNDTKLYYFNQGQLFDTASVLNTIVNGQSNRVDLFPAQRLIPNIEAKLIGRKLAVNGRGQLRT